MPDACDFMVDLQLDAADLFMANRVAASLAIAAGSADCITCGDPIAASRLEAAPDACRCVPCQTLFELHGSRASWKPAKY